MSGPAHSGAFLGSHAGGSDDRANPEAAVDAAWEAFQRPEGKMGSFGAKARLRYALRAYEAALRRADPPTEG